MNIAHVQDSIPFECHTVNLTGRCGKKNSSMGPIYYYFFSWRYNPLWVCILQPSSGAIVSSLSRFHKHTKRRATVGRTLLDEWSIRRRDLYLTTHNTHNRQTPMPWVRFEPTFSAGELLLLLMPENIILFVTEINNKNRIFFFFVYTLQKINLQIFFVKDFENQAQFSEKWVLFNWRWLLLYSEKLFHDPS